MPIRLNLLAEEQDAEEMRRRDPVKCSIWVAGLLVALVLCWSGWLQLKLGRAERKARLYEDQWLKLEKDFNRVMQDLKNTAEVERKLATLHTLATERFLWGNPLQALQQTLVDNVQLVRLRAAQTFALTEEVKPTTNDTHVVPGKPATATEKIGITIEAKDFSRSPGVKVSQFKDTLAGFAYFKENLKPVDGVKLAQLSPPDVTDPQKPFVLFTLNCFFPDKTRTK